MSSFIQIFQVLPGFFKFYPDFPSLPRLFKFYPDFSSFTQMFLFRTYLILVQCYFSSFSKKQLHTFKFQKLQCFQDQWPLILTTKSVKRVQQKTWNRSKGKRKWRPYPNRWEVAWIDFPKVAGSSALLINGSKKRWCIQLRVTIFQNSPVLWPAHDWLINHTLKKGYQNKPVCRIIFNFSHTAVGKFGAFFNIIF